MKKLLVLVLLLSLIVPAVGSAGAQDDEVTLRFTFWIPTDHPAAVDIYQPMAEAFEAENPGVSIEYSFIPFDEYEQTIVTQLSGDNPPDAGWVVERSGPGFLNAGVLMDLSGVLSADEAYDYADFSDPALGLWKDGDALYAIPFSTSPQFTLFNKTLFDEAGIDDPATRAANGEWTWESLADAAKTIKDETGAWGFVSSDAALYTSAGHAWGTLVPLLRAYGTDIFNADNECTMNSDEAVAAFELLYSMIFDDQSVVPPGSETVFWSGDAAVTFAQTSRLSNLDDAEFEWGITTLPAGPGGDVSVIGQAAIAVFDGRNNEHQDIAAEFVKFLTTKEGVAQHAAFFPPARLSVLESDDFLNSNSRLGPDDMQIVADAIANGSVLTAHANFPEIELLGATALDLMWMSDADVQSTLDMYCDLITPSLQ